MPTKMAWASVRLANDDFASMNQGDAHAAASRSLVDAVRALIFKSHRSAFSAGVAAVFADHSSSANQRDGASGQDNDEAFHADRIVVLQRCHPNLATATHTSAGLGGLRSAVVPANVAASGDRDHESVCTPCTACSRGGLPAAASGAGP